MKKIIIFIAIFTFCIIQPFSFTSAKSNNELKVAFIKNKDLWIKMHDKEIKISDGDNVKFPKWSYDGNWIAYMKGTSLWLYNVESNKHFNIFSNVSTNFQWAPNKNTLAFQSDKSLKVIDVTALEKHHNIASDIINFSWLPDGNGFITSSKAGESVFSDILLSKIKLKDNYSIKLFHFYLINVGEKDYFYGTSQFKWSYDGKWIAFQLTPTASLSADSNTLCVLANDGSSFHRIDEMLNYEEWFHWAPIKNSLAYIQGSNRVSTINKKLEIKKIPNGTKVFTPKEFVDRDLTWQNDNQIFVSRSAESDLVDVTKRPMPSIYHINLQNNLQNRITFPKKNEGDFHPININNGEQLIWIRTNRETASVYIASTNDLNPQIWIKKIDLGTWYYEHWNWNEVFSIYQPKSES